MIRIEIEPVWRFTKGDDAQSLHRIRCYLQIEFIHAAVAAYVASEMADVAFGVEAAARQFHLDFIRLLTEDYVFVCIKPMLETAPVKRVLAVCAARNSAHP